jgi:hypothetical protein
MMAAPRATAWPTHVAVVLGVSAFSVSYAHVVTQAWDSGQKGAYAFGIATTIELVAAASAGEIRTRKRLGVSVRWPWCVLTAGALLSVACNLAVAKPTAWGYVMAAVPQLAFLAVASMIETRPTSATGPAVAAEAPPEAPVLAVSQPTPAAARAAVTEHLAEQLAADPEFRPDYDALVQATGYSRSWVEKRWADVRNAPAPAPEPEYAY